MLRKMGCLLSKIAFWRRPRHEELQEEQPKQYSWDKRREEFKKEDYILKDQKDATLGRVPGTVNGQQFIIENCENCNIYIFDHIAAITIDDCINCNFFLGPTKTSAFIRDCKNCKVVVSCQQYRTRDCSKIDTFLCCNTQPIIEASSGMKFGCYQYHYPELEEQFKSADLTVFTNNWGKIHDFSQDPTEEHFSNLPEVALVGLPDMNRDKVSIKNQMPFIPYVLFYSLKSWKDKVFEVFDSTVYIYNDAKVDDYVPIPLAEEFSKMEISVDSDKSVVPKTHGTRRKPSDESTLIVFFNDGSSTERAISFIGIMRQSHPECILIQTKEVDLRPDDAQRVFNTDSYTTIVQQGPVIGMEFNGDDCVEICKNEALGLMKGSIGLVFISQNPTEADKQIEDFYNFAEMQMAI